jgi:DNA invertase Pin-like site-specific DNA recombinase
MPSATAILPASAAGRAEPSERADTLPMRPSSKPYRRPAQGRYEPSQPSLMRAAFPRRPGCTTIRSEKRSGTTTEGREELRTVLDFLREGDVLMVTRIDRLARSIGDLQDIVRAVRARGASLKATEQPIDTGTAAGKCFLDMLGVFAEFETNLRRERQLEGIAKAKAAGVYKGRPASIDAAQVRAMKAEGKGASEIAKALKIGRASVYRVLEADEWPIRDLLDCLSPKM